MIFSLGGREREVLASERILDKTFYIFVFRYFLSPSVELWYNGTH